MKILALRLFSLAVLVGASSWAVWGDDGKKHTHGSPTAAKSTTTRSTTSPVVATPVKSTITVSAPKPSVVAQTPSPAATPATVKTPLVPAPPAIAVPVTAPTPATTWTPAAPVASKPAAPATAPTIAADPTVHLSLTTLAPTPEMWFYEQMRQDYNNPDLQARLRGEKAAAERRARLAARAWYGVSNSRPMAHVTPFTYYYSPFWASNPVNPYIWTNRGTSTQVIIETARRPATVSGFGVW